MLIVRGDDISIDVTTLGAYYYVLFNVCVHSGSFPLRADWRKSDSSVDGEPQGNLEVEYQIPETLLQADSFFFPARCQIPPGSFLASVSDPKQYHNQAP